jgi:hypothetical protein
MKFLRNMFGGLAIAALALLAASPAPAQQYPFQTPTYIPSAVVDVTTLSAAGDYYFTANGTSGASVRISALSGTLVAAIQGSNDPLGTANASASWSTLQFIPLTGGAVATSITANGLYGFNTAGFTRFRVHVTTLSGGSHVATIQAAATVGPSVVYSINPNQGLSNTFQAPLPYLATQITATSGDVAASAAVATLAGTSGKTTYINGFQCSSTGATGAAAVDLVVSGTISGSLTYIATAVAGATLVNAPINVNFPYPIQASAPNTAIVVTLPSLGTGNLHAVCNAQGFQL